MNVSSTLSPYTDTYARRQLNTRSSPNKVNMTQIS